MASEPMELPANAQLDVTHVSATGPWTAGAVRVDDDGVHFRPGDAKDAATVPFASIHRAKHSKFRAWPYDVVLELERERLVWALRVDDGPRLLEGLRARGVRVDP